MSKSLKVGDLLRDRTGTWKPILSIEKVAETKAIYNFEVVKNHDYFVGESGWLVHNDSLTQTYEILDGVRRAKAAQYMGKETIPAIIEEAGVAVKSVDVPISKLLSPRDRSY